MHYLVHVYVVDSQDNSVVVKTAQPCGMAYEIKNSRKFFVTTFGGCFIPLINTIFSINKKSVSLPIQPKPYTTSITNKLVQL